MAGTHDNVVRRVLPPLSLEKIWTARYVVENLRWCKCFSKTDHINFIVGSIIFVLVKPTFFLNPAKHTPYCIGQFIVFYSSAELFPFGWSQNVQNFLLKV